ncbi:hypothetical protein CICLE_v10010134mg [Citrus x clementina]|uniref:Uncharacterized protein n=1 Tax=Citrus clementina TaxID=85681 RepID=V4TSD0_CITCL|nr:hypothetical protein CICLE_v10010134mg [Citrus x clementina]
MFYHYKVQRNCNFSMTTSCRPLKGCPCREQKQSGGYERMFMQSQERMNHLDWPRTEQRHR